MKTLQVHVVYPKDPFALTEFIKTLLDHCIPFSYSVGYVSGPHSFEPFIREQCPELEGRLTCCTERWAENCKGYKIVKDSSKHFEIQPKEGGSFTVAAEPFHALRLEKFLNDNKKALNINYGVS